MEDKDFTPTGWLRDNDVLTPDGDLYAVTPKGKHLLGRVYNVRFAPDFSELERRVLDSQSSEVIRKCQKMAFVFDSVSLHDAIKEKMRQHQEMVALFKAQGCEVVELQDSVFINMMRPTEDYRITASMNAPLGAKLDKPKNTRHGPKKVGRGGKIRRW